MDNKQISSRFRLLAQLMEFYGENVFKIKNISAAALLISKYPIRLETASKESLIKLEGFGKSTVLKIIELLENGSIAELEALKERTPQGIIELLGLRGLGPKKIQSIFTQLGIDNPADLYYACNENRLAELTGFGLKSQAEIKKLLEFSFNNKGSYLYPAANRLAESWLQALLTKPFIQQAVLTGALRRKCEIIQEIHILTECTQPALLSDYLGHYRNFSTTHTPLLTYHFQEEASLPVSISVTSKQAFFTDLFITTGNERHVSLLKPALSNSNYYTENELYEKNSLPYIVPELREGRHEIEDALAGKTANLIELSDLKGSVHNHTTYSDGLNTIHEMAHACKEANLEYLVVTDHSRSAFYAKGMSSQAIERQHLEIDELNTELAPFKIIKGVESDILSDGKLDYDSETLKKFDLIIASVHSNLRMDKRKATDRLIEAVSSPYVTILGHPTGRLLLGREGYPIDHKAVLEACANSGVAIEINANPSRLDLDWRWVREATGLGIMLSINPDAHSIAGLHDIIYGVNAARKGGLLRSSCLNALTLNELEHYLRKRKNLILS